MNHLKSYFLFLLASIIILFSCGYKPERPAPVKFSSSMPGKNNFNLDSVILKITKRWNYQFEGIAPGQFAIDVSIQQKDSSYHYQQVFVWIVKGRYYDKDVVYVNSRCGEYKQGLDLYKLLQENGYGTYSTLTITSDTHADGSDYESVIAQAVQPVAFTNELILNEVIYDVATTADQVKETYFKDSLR